MLLAIDIGNTNIVLGLFEGESIVKRWRLDSHSRKTEDEWALHLHNILTNSGYNFSDIRDIALSSVVPALTPVFQALSKKFLSKDALNITNEIDHGLTIVYKDPSTVGADRICNAAAGFKIYGGPLVIIDFGTATTYDVISKTGEYLGGLISPGLETAALQLHRRAAKLPTVELEFPDEIVAKSTEKSMQAGIMFGAIAQIEGIIKRIEDELGDTVIAISTGGIGGVIKDKTPLIIAYEPDLTLIGIQMIYKKQNI
ncbi:MAG: type III pantothenate kinase [bacterium]|nr:type III pantothenate kinase [bacterium]